MLGRRGVLACVVGVLAGALTVPALSDLAPAPTATTYARVEGTEVVLGNDLVERRWARDVLVTTSITDKRADGHQWPPSSTEFRLHVPFGTIGSGAFAVDDVATAVDGDGVARVVWHLSHPGLAVDRVVEVYPGVAGFRSRMLLRPLAGFAIAGATLDEIAPGANVTATRHAFRAGADWREPGYAGPDLTVGDPHAGTWRDSTTGAPGAPVDGAGQWLNLAAGDRTAALVMERPDWPSSRVAYDGTLGQLVVDYTRDVVGLGPLEENGHIENPADDVPVGRARPIAPGESLALDPAFLALGTGDGDAEWQWAKYLRDVRAPAYRKDVVFNSNGTDDNVISTGAKDDMNIAVVRQVAPVARALGVDVFVLDDGWQAISGDWYPDSPDHPEPRYDGTPGSKFAPRFPDSTFAAVRAAIAPMRLGLWMSPMHFNPASATYRAHPEWACTPVGHGLVVANSLTPDDGSNEAGIAEWGPAAIPHVEARIREAITAWEVSYFKFDFLAWLDCLGQGSLHDYADAFAAMLDRLSTDFPSVTFQVDETNDYRLFPFASVTRGPSWFQNGSPPLDRLLHNMWNLSPWVPAYSLGQHVLGGSTPKDNPVSTLVMAAMPSHVTLFSDLRQLAPAVVTAAAPWFGWHAAHRALFRGVTYPLLGEPLEKGWTALQTWDPEAATGALVAFRQDASAGDARIALRNIPDGSYRITAAPDDRPIGVFSASALRSGLPVSLPLRGAVAYAISRVGDAPVESAPLPATR